MFYLGPRPRGSLGPSQVWQMVRKIWGPGSSAGWYMYMDGFMYSLESLSSFRFLVSQMICFGSEKEFWGVWTKKILAEVTGPVVSGRALTKVFLNVELDSQPRG